MLFPMAARSEEAANHRAGVGSLRSASAQLRREFDRAVNYVKSGDIVAAGGVLDRLRVSAKSAGVAGMPEFSFELFGIAQRMLRFAETENADIARFLVVRAVELGGKDPRVALGASAFWQVVGVRAAVIYLVSAVANSWRSPAFALGMGNDIVLVVLTALTLGFAVTGIVQHARCSPVALQSLAGKRPGRAALLSGAGLYLAVLVVPLRFGITAAAGVWAIAAAWLLAHCRAVGAAVGILLVVWVLVLPVSNSLRERVSSRTERAIEDAQLGRLSDWGMGVLVSAAAGGSRDPLLLESLAKIRLRDGDLGEAEALARSVIGSSVIEQRVYATGLGTLGCVLFREQRYPEAVKSFEAAIAEGGPAYELYTNLTYASVAQTDVEGQRRYEELARQADPGRWERERGAAASSERLLEIPVGVDALAQRLLRPMVYVSASERLSAEGDVWKIAELGGTRGGSLLLAVAVFVLGFPWLFVHAHQNGTSRPKAEPAALFWWVLPGGGEFAGDRPVRGALKLGAFLVLIFVAADYPVVFGASVYGRSISDAAAVGAVAVEIWALLVLAWNLWGRESEARI